MMKTERKLIIKIAEDTDNAKNSRRTLKDLQKTAVDKENLAGRPHTFKDAKNISEAEKSDFKKKKALMLHKGVQVGEYIITAEDLTSDEPSVDYWKRLAETRGEALDDSLQENQKLKESIETLQEENKICKEMLDESKHLIEVLQELLNEQEDDNEGNAENPNDNSS